MAGRTLVTWQRCQCPGARTLHPDEAIDEPALAAMFRQIIANNRAGGWRKLKREG